MCKCRVTSVCQGTGQSKSEYALHILCDTVRSASPFSIGVVSETTWIRETNVSPPHHRRPTRCSGKLADPCKLKAPAFQFVLHRSDAHSETSNAEEPQRSLPTRTRPWILTLSSYRQTLPTHQSTEEPTALQDVSTRNKKERKTRM